jgi:phosphocarrier protein HPr
MASAAETARQEIEITNARGLHARASAKFVAAVSKLPAGTEVTVCKDGVEAAGSSILGLMMLGAAKGDTIELKVSGEDAEARLAELVSLVEGGFGEE